jgi:hypothetical protein
MLDSLDSKRLLLHYTIGANTIGATNFFLFLLSIMLDRSVALALRSRSNPQNIKQQLRQAPKRTAKQTAPALTI